MKYGIDDWETRDFTCIKCSWKGVGSALQYGDLQIEGCEMHCPSCTEAVAWLEFPPVEEMLANFDKLRPADQAMALLLSEGQKKWRKERLNSVDQLPEIEADYILLSWDEDQDTKEIVIRHGRDEIFRQTTSWEYYDFFIAACRILKTKYGYRLIDVIPTPRVYGNIVGDCLLASDYTDEMRRLIREDHFRTNTEGRQIWKTFRLDYDA